MFDTRQYDWNDITLMLGGRDITGIRGISYKEVIEREPLYGKGRYPHSIQSGNVSYEGEITLLQSELEALIQAGKGSILRLKGLAAVISYGQLPDGVITDKIEGIYFTESPKAMSQGDKNMEITLPFVALRVNQHT